MFRTPADCCDRYRQHVQYMGTKREGVFPRQCLQLFVDTVFLTRLQLCVIGSDGTAFIIQGAWSEEEESQLLHAMEELTKEGRTDLSARGCWVSVSKALGATRTPKQCRNKWCVRSLLRSAL